MAKLRAFLALPISAEVGAQADRIIRKLSATDGPAVRWAETDQLHITVKFFGDIAPERTHEIYRRVQPILSSSHSFELRIQGVGAFPDVDRPRTIWAGIGDGESPLVDLAEQIEDAMLDLGFAAERRRYRPHLTLGRVKGRGELSGLVGAIRELESEPLGVSLAETMVLYSSRLTRSGPTYERLATLPIGE